MAGREVMHKLRSQVDRFRRKKPEVKLQTPEQIAQEAFSLMSAAGPEGQQPIAEYQVDFDLRKYSPGTVFRVEIKDEKNNKVYHWHAIGAICKDEAKIYLPYEYWNDRYNLRFDMQDRVLERNVSQLYFQISEMHVALFKSIPPKKEDYPIYVNGKTIEWSDVFHPSKIEVMHAGHTVKEKAEEKVRVGVPVLQILPE